MYFKTTSKMLSADADVRADSNVHLDVSRTSDDNASKQPNVQSQKIRAALDDEEQDGYTISEEDKDEVKIDLFTRGALPHALMPDMEAHAQPIVLLRLSWILDRAEQAASGADIARFTWPHRKDLARDAIMPIEEFIAGCREEPREETARRHLMLVCHPWYTKDHPDPACDQLLELAECINALRRKYENLPPAESIGVIFDYSSLYQHQDGIRRTVEEKVCFKQGLRSMNWLFAHQFTIVVVLSSHPISLCHNPLPLFDRGWPYFEIMISHLLKTTEPTATSSWPRIIYSTAPPQAQPIDCDNSDVLPYFAGTTISIDRATFEARLGRRRFTNGRVDADIAAVLYERIRNIVSERRARVE